MNVSAIDLFCGVGGLTKGLELAGINVIAGYDFEKSCQFAYEYNNTAKFIHQDITKLNGESVLNLYPNGDIKILAGCAPCQPFSKLTHRYRKEGYTDDKWRLLYSYLRLIKEVNPEIIAMENVPELMHTSVFTDFVNELKENNYYIDYKTVYCPDYGIPQKRKRLVLVASKYGKITLIEPTHTKDNYISVRMAIGDLPPLSAGKTDENDKLHTSSSLNDTNLKRIQASVQGGTWRDWPENLQLECHKKDSGKSYPSVYGRMCWDEPSPTITTQFYGYGNGRFGHPEQNRALSLREGAILQSFPKEYKFFEDGTHVSKRVLGTQIGNAVPVGIGTMIGKSILRHLEEINNGKKSNK